MNNPYYKRADRVMRPLSYLDRLGERGRPHYGQLVLWTLLLCACAHCLYFELYWGVKPEGSVRVHNPASLLSFLPEAVTLNRGVCIAFGVLFAAGAVLWFWRRLLPWSAWATAALLQRRGRALLREFQLRKRTWPTSPGRSC